MDIFGELMRGEAEDFRSVVAGPPAEFEALMRRLLRGVEPNGELDAARLNDFIDHWGDFPVPDQWIWTGARVEGQFTTDVCAGVREWARWSGDGIVRAELLSDDILWADCSVYGHRLTVWGYLPYIEMLGIPGLVLEFRP